MSIKIRVVWEMLVDKLFCKGPDGNVIGFVSYMVSITTNQLYYHHSSHRQHITSNHDCVPIKLF